MFYLFAPLRIWHRLWVATVRAWLPTKGMRDSRRYALPPKRDVTKR